MTEGCDSGGVVPAGSCMSLAVYVLEPVLAGDEASTGAHCMMAELS